MSKNDWGIEDPEETFWFNTRTGKVEVGPQSLAVDRLGPFTSRADAERATEIIAERARKWAEEDAEND